MARIPKSKDINTLIYTLSDPDTKEIRYVGKTVKSLKSRLSNHIYTSKKFNNYRCNWIQSILNRGKKPLIDVIDSCLWEESQELETYWIAQFKAWNFNLVNATNGGEGNLGIILTKERKDKLILSVSKKVYQYNLKGEFLKEFPSCAQAGRELNFISFQKISLAARGLRGQAAKFMWSYDKIERMKSYGGKHKKKICQIK